MEYVMFYDFDSNLGELNILKSILLNKIIVSALSLIIKITWKSFIDDLYLLIINVPLLKCNNNCYFHETFETYLKAFADSRWLFNSKYSNIYSYFLKNY